MLFLDQFKPMDYELDGYKSSITNITRSFLIKHLKTDTSLMIQPYTIKGLETPESVAYKLYGDATYHWIILMLNNIVDPFNDWVLSDERVLELAERKYTTGAKGVHHYLNPATGEQLDDVAVRDNEIVNPITVTNLTYEQEQNENRRSILVIAPRAIEKTVLLFEGLIANAS